MSKTLFFMAALAISFISPFSSFGQADEADPSLVFICHKGLNYSKNEVVFAFRGYLDEPRPVDNRPLFHAMLKTIGYSDTRYTRIWNKMFFRRGLFKPKSMGTDQEVIQWVAASYAGVGYVKAAPQGNPNVEVCGQD